jgi:hypothetical protein
MDKSMQQIAMEARFQELVRQRDMALADSAFKAGRIAELEAQLKLMQSDDPDNVTSIKGKAT